MLETSLRTNANTPPTTASARRRHHHPNLERLICAAASDDVLARLLIEAPEQALAECEAGRCLTPVERLLVFNVHHVNDLSEFADRLHGLVAELHRYDGGDQTYEQRQESPQFQAHGFGDRTRATWDGTTRATAAMYSR